MTTSPCGRRTHSNADAKLQNHAEESSTRRDPGIYQLLKSYNDLCTKIEALIRRHQAPQGAIAPVQIPREGLFKLKVDDPIWDDIGLDESLDEEAVGVPRWLGDEKVRQGIPAMLKVDRCVEEQERLVQERVTLEEWAGAEWHAIQAAIARSVAYAPYADALWMETKKPILAQAQEFAQGVHAVHPDVWLAYNLSPSFNWEAAGLGPAEMKSYIWELGKLGFVWQFITLGGLHSNGYISDLFARAFKDEGMKAYVELVQRREREIGCDVLTHQKWSGAEYVDGLLKTITGGVSSTAAMGKGVTEDQFKAQVKL